MPMTKGTMIVHGRREKNGSVIFDTSDFQLHIEVDAETAKGIKDGDELEYELMTVSSAKFVEVKKKA